MLVRFAWSQGRVWRCVVGGAIALTVIAGAVFSVLRGHSLKKRDGYLSRAQSYFSTREYDRAIAEYTDAIRLDPKCALAYANRASSYFNQGELEQALNDCNRALELDPRLALAYANRGGAYLNRGEYDRALADCTRAPRA